MKALWDSTGKSWVAYGVPGQPAALLVGADGKIKESWLGPLDYDAVLKALAA